MSPPLSQSPLQQSKRLMQLRFADRRRYLKKLSRATRRNSSLPQVTRPRSHALHQLVLCNRQQLSRRRVIWDDQRQKTYDRRDFNKAQFDRLICSADPCHVAALEREKQADCDQHMVIIQRFNFSSADVVGGSALVDSPLQHFVQVASLGAHETDAVSSPSLKLPDISERQRQVVLAIVMADVPWPSNTTIRSTPRRPGAPSAALPH